MCDRSMSSRSAGWQGSTSKQEGITALNDCVLAIGDDNDFGVLQGLQSQLNIVQLGTCMTELYATLKPSSVSSAGPGGALLALNDLPSNASSSPAGTVIGA